MWQLALLHVRQTNRKKIHDFAVPKTTNTNQIGTFVDQNVLHLKDMKQLIYAWQSASNKLKLDETRSPKS